jgi:Domain of unknown function (DUF5619)
MKTITASRPAASTNASRFESARALARSLAEADDHLIEPELIAWIDRSTAATSPVLEGCGGPNAWHDYGVTHDGRLEVDVGDDTAFIFAESSAYDSYDHFGPGPYVNIHDDQGKEMICRVGGVDCVPLDDWASKLT